MAALLAIGVPSIARAAEPSPAPATAAPPRPVQIDKNSVLILVRTVLVALQQANQTGNYTVLYGISSPSFQSLNPPERLSQIFANLRSKNFDLSGVVVLEPQFTVLPELYSNSVMRLAGFFPSTPMQVFFDLQFVPVQGQWRLVGIAIDVGGSAPAAPREATPNPALASSHSPTPAATAIPSPTATPSPSSVAVEVRPPAKATPTPTPPRKTRAGQSLGRP